MNFLRLLPVFIILTLPLFSGYPANAVSVIPNPAPIHKVQPGKKEQLRVQLEMFANLSLRQYEKLRGRKLNFFEKISFKLNRHRTKEMLRHYNNWDEPTSLQKISWFVKGLILGPVALILGYIFLRDEQRELIKWIWFGFAGWCAIVALVLIAAA